MTVAILGYASMDYPAVLGGYFVGDQTVLMKRSTAASFPRPGGCPLYVAGPIVDSGVTTAIITWVGDDEPGEQFRRSVASDGIALGGIATVSPGNTPSCFLLYQPDGSCGCCFDPGTMGREVLTDAQRQTLAAADLVCFTVGPPDLARETLDLISADAKVAWVAKNDPVSFPSELRNQLGARTDYIFCNNAERPWVDRSLDCRKRPAPLIFETSGAGSVQIFQSDQIHKLGVDPLRVSDPCGAGDTLAGGCLSALHHGESPQDAGRNGIVAARRLLEQRQLQWNPHE